MESDTWNADVRRRWRSSSRFVFNSIFWRIDVRSGGKLLRRGGSDRNGWPLGCPVRRGHPKSQRNSDRLVLVRYRSNIDEMDRRWWLFKETARRKKQLKTKISGVGLWWPFSLHPAGSDIFGDENRRRKKKRKSFYSFQPPWPLYRGSLSRRDTPSCEALVTMAVHHGSTPVFVSRSVDLEISPSCSKRGENLYVFLVFQVEEKGPGGCSTL